MFFLVSKNTIKIQNKRVFINKKKINYILEAIFRMENTCFKNKKKRKSKF